MQHQSNIHPWRMALLLIIVLATPVISREVVYNLTDRQEKGRISRP